MDQMRPRSCRRLKIIFCVYNLNLREVSGVVSGGQWWRIVKQWAPSLSRTQYFLRAQFMINDSRHERIDYNYFNHTLSPHISRIAQSDYGG